AVAHVDEAVVVVADAGGAGECVPVLVRIGGGGRDVGVCAPGGVGVAAEEGAVGVGEFADVAVGVGVEVAGARRGGPVKDSAVCGGFDGVAAAGGAGGELLEEVAAVVEVRRASRRVGLADASALAVVGVGRRLVAAGLADDPVGRVPAVAGQAHGAGVGLAAGEVAVGVVAVVDGAVGGELVGGVVAVGRGDGASDGLGGAVSSGVVRPAGVGPERRLGIVAGRGGEPAELVVPVAAREGLAGDAARRGCALADGVVAVVVRRHEACGTGVLRVAGRDDVGGLPGVVVAVGRDDAVRVGERGEAGGVVGEVELAGRIAEHAEPPVGVVAVRVAGGEAAVAGQAEPGPMTKHVVAGREGRVGQVAMLADDAAAIVVGVGRRAGAVVHGEGPAG